MLKNQINSENRINWKKKHLDKWIKLVCFTVFTAFIYGWPERLNEASWITQWTFWNWTCISGKIERAIAQRCRCMFLFILSECSTSTCMKYGFISCCCSLVWTCTFHRFLFRDRFHHFCVCWLPFEHLPYAFKMSSIHPKSWFVRIMNLSKGVDVGSFVWIWC